MNKFISKYSQQLILALLVIAVTAGVGFAGYAIPDISSGFLRKAEEGKGIFKYGYGFGYFNNLFQLGYGYGYDGLDRGNNYGSGPDYSDYGFFDGYGDPGVSVNAITKTTASLHYSTGYLAQVGYDYAASYPIDKNNVIFSDQESTFNSGNRTVTLVGLTCDTKYYIEVNATDAGQKTRTVNTSFTTDKCSSGDSSSTPSNSVGSYTNLKPFGAKPESNTLGGSFPESPKLYYGDFGPGPKKLQLLLNKLGFTLGKNGAGSPGHETSFFGPKTKAALKKFQIAHGLTPDGIYGPLVQAAMQIELNK